MTGEPCAGEKRPRRSSPEDQIPDSGSTLGGSQAKRTKGTDEPSAAKYRETPSHMIKGLLSLPDEVLLKITRGMGSETMLDQLLDTQNQDLRHLALVCRRLRPIAQEVLFSSVQVNWSNLGFVTRTLVETPELFVNTKTLLYTNEDVLWDHTNPLSLLSLENLAVWKQELQQSFGNTQASEMLEDISTWGLFTRALVQALMALLLTKAPRLSKIYMEQVLDELPLFPLLFAEQTLYESVQTLMHGKLEEALFRCFFFADRTHKLISFSRYRSLKRLHLNDDFLWELLRTNERLSVSKGRIIQYLPPNLEYFRLDFDPRFRRIEIDRYLKLTILIEELAEVPSFKKLEVEIEETISGFFYMILKIRRDQDHIRVHEVKAMLESWRTSKMDLQFYLDSKTVGVHVRDLGDDGYDCIGGDAMDATYNICPVVRGPLDPVTVQDILTELTPILELPDTQVPLDVVENFIKTQPFFGLKNDYDDI